MKNKKYFLKYFCLFCILLFVSPLTSDIKEFKLDNGLKIIVIKDNKVPLVTFQIWYKVGSIDETIGKTGISHLLEHLMFKGTKKYGSKVFSNLVQKNGGIDNAFTSVDYTVYFQTLPSDKIDLSIKLEADRMKNLLIDEKNFQSEQNVVMEERRMRYDDDPSNLLFENVIASAFKSHSYHWPVIGWMSDLASLQKEDAITHYKKFYSPDNAFIVVAGDVKVDKIILEIKKHFGNIKPTRQKYSLHKPKESEQQGQRRIELNKEAELPYIIIAYHCPNLHNKDSFALEVLSNVFSNGKSSRLYKNIVYEKKLAIDSSASYSALYRDDFLFSFDAKATEGSKIEDIEKAIYEEIEKVKNLEISQDELQKAKNQVESSFIFAQDSNYAKALYAGMFEMMGSWRLADTYLDGIRKVTAEDVKSVAHKYFQDTNKTVGILIPTKKESK